MRQANVFQQDKANNTPAARDIPISGRLVQSCHDVNSKLHEIRAESSMQKSHLEDRDLIEYIPSLDSYGSPSDEVNHRKRAPIEKQPLRSLIQPRKIHVGVQKKIQKTKRGQWSNEALHLAIEAFDEGYAMSQVSAKYKICRSSIRDHNLIFN